MILAVILLNKRDMPSDMWGHESGICKKKKKWENQFCSTFLTLKFCHKKETENNFWIASWLLWVLPLLPGMGCLHGRAGLGLC